MPPNPLRDRKPIQPSEAVNTALAGGFRLNPRYPGLALALLASLREWGEGDYQGIKQYGYMLAAGRN